MNIDNIITISCKKMLALKALLLFSNDETGSGLESNPTSMQLEIMRY